MKNEDSPVSFHKLDIRTVEALVGRKVIGASVQNSWVVCKLEGDGRIIRFKKW